MESQFTRADLLALLPATILAITGIVALLAELFLPSDTSGTAIEVRQADRQQPAHGKQRAAKEPGAHLGFIGLSGGLLALGALFYDFATRGDALTLPVLSGALLPDAFAAFAATVIIAAAILTALSASSYLASHGAPQGEFHGLLWMGAAAMVFLCQANNLLSVFISIETLSLSVYALTGYFRQWKQSSEGALKYFTMGAFASGFLLLGIAFLYGSTGSIQLAQLTSPDADPLLSIVGVLLVIVAFGFKIGAVPFHSWVPDAYQGAPAFSAGWMAVAVKVASFAALLRLVVIVAGGGALAAPDRGGVTSYHDAIGLVLAILAVATMILGNLAAIRQTNIKRMLAYSGIAHSGYLLVAVYLVYRGEGQQEAASALLFYVASYLLMTFAAFAVVGLVSRGEQDREELSEFHGLAARHPAIALAFTIALLSLAGIPLTGGFIGKLLVFQGALRGAIEDGSQPWDQGLFNMAIVGILGSIVSAYYYLRPIVAMYFRESPRGEDNFAIAAPWGIHLSLLLVTAGTILTGVFPQKVLELSQIAARSILPA